MLLALALGIVGLGRPVAPAAPAPVAARCSYGLGVIMQPPGLLEIYKYQYIGGGLQRSTRLGSANVRGGTLSPLCTRVKAQKPPVHPRGLAGPWPRSVESSVYCGEGGTVQIRPIVSKKRVVGTRLLVLRKDLNASPTNHFLDGRHVIVDVVLRAKSGGISFDPNYCDRASIK
jgi:hypothetical protein